MFENFLQTCDFIEPLLDGMAQFMGMMVSIIQDVYHIDLDLVELKRTSKEMKEEGPSSIQEVSTKRSRQEQGRRSEREKQNIMRCRWNACLKR